MPTSTYPTSRSWVRRLNFSFAGICTTWAEGRRARGNFKGELDAVLQNLEALEALQQKKSILQRKAKVRGTIECTHDAWGDGPAPLSLTSASSLGSRALDEGLQMAHVAFEWRRPALNKS